MIVLFLADPKDRARLNKLIADRLADDLTRFASNACQLISTRFPDWLIEEHPERCHRALADLQRMASDQDEHFLTPLLEFALYHSLHDWWDVEQGTCAGAGAADLNQATEDIDLALDTAFPTTNDFNTVPYFATALLQDGALDPDTAADVATYLDLLPDTVRAKVEQRLKTAAELHSSPTSYARISE